MEVQRIGHAVVHVEQDAGVNRILDCGVAQARVNPSMAHSFGSIGAVRQSANTASTMSSFFSFPRASDATAPCAPVQKRHWLRRDVNAANSSRSPTLHSDGPRITA